jgi:hypothetical protein
MAESIALGGAKLADAREEPKPQVLGTDIA